MRNLHTIAPKAFNRTDEINAIIWWFMRTITSYRVKYTSDETIFIKGGVFGPTWKEASSVWSKADINYVINRWVDNGKPILPHENEV